MEKESTEYQYSIVLDILAEMVTKYLVMNESNISDVEENRSEKHAV